MIDFGTLYVALIGYGLVEVVASALLTLRGHRSSDANFWGALLGLVPSLLGVGGALAGNKSKADAAKDDRAIANANDAARLKAVQDVMAQARAAGYNPYGPQTSTDQSTTTTSTNDKIRKVIDPLMRGGAEQAVAQMQSEMNRDIFGPAQLAELARQTNRGADVSLNNMAASRQLSPAQLGAMKFMATSARTSPVLAAQAAAPEKNAAYRAGIRGQMLDWTNATMGENRTGQTVQNMTGSRTSGPNLQDLLALAQAQSPQNVSTKTGYNPWAEGLSAAGDLGAAAMSIFGNKPKNTVATLPAARDMTWAGLGR